MIITNYSGSIIAHKSSENIVQVRGMSSDDVITDALKAKLNKTDGYIDSMVYFRMIHQMRIFKNLVRP